MRRLYFSLGKNKFWEYVLLALFLLFFYGPLMNMLLLSFAGDYAYLPMSSPGATDSNGGIMCSPRHSLYNPSAHRWCWLLL